MNEDLREFNLAGKRFGRLVAVSFDHYENGTSYWLCQCDCGGTKVASRKQLQNGHTKSCGCVRGKGNRTSSFAPRDLTPKEEKWLITHFKHTKNDEICEKLKISGSFLHRFARKHGLTKSPQFMRKVQGEATAKAKQSHLKNGTYPPKGYRIPRSEEHQYTAGPRKETPKKKAARLEKAHASLEQTRKMERIRAHWGIPQKTNLKVIAQPREKVCLRHTLRKLGYVIERGSDTAYYTPDTKRSRLIESRKYGDNHYFYFDFKPLQLCER